jgi:uncharacterized membrane protein YcjF (UPF0283 family)
MNVDFEKVDEAEKISRQEHAKLSNRNFKATGILLVVYLAARLLHWMIGFPSSLTEVNYGFVSILGVIYLGYMLELLRASLREVRLRSKETNERLTEIEKRIDSQTKRMSKQLSAIESKLGSRTNGLEETQIAMTKTMRMMGIENRREMRHSLANIMSLPNAVRLGDNIVLESPITTALE